MELSFLRVTQSGKGWYQTLISYVCLLQFLENPLRKLYNIIYQEKLYKQLRRNTEECSNSLQEVQKGKQQNKKWGKHAENK